MFLLFFLLPAILYTLLLGWIYHQWTRQSVVTPSPDWVPSTGISVLIPARNEAHRIEACLKAILEQRYPSPLLEIIVIDDFSTDDTASRVNAYLSSGVQLLRLTDFVKEESLRAPKKSALELGVRRSRFPLIVTTDADTVASPQWLRHIAWMVERQGAEVVAGPVLFHREQHAFERAQTLDYVGMMGVTQAGIFTQSYHLANGANLAYTRAVFQQYHGFSGIDQIASGDDMLLVQKVAAREPEKIAFLKSRAAVVYSYAQPDWPAFLQQRLRWASKGGHYRGWRIYVVQGAVYASCMTLTIGLPVVLLAGTGWQCWLIALLLKGVADYGYLRALCRFFGRADLMRAYWGGQVFHLVYIAGVGTLSFFIKRYKWKGRKLR